jgi:hypothetical protein
MFLVVTFIPNKKSLSVENVDLSMSIKMKLGACQFRSGHFMSPTNLFSCRFDYTKLDEGKLSIRGRRKKDGIV